MSPSVAAKLGSGDEVRVLVTAPQSEIDRLSRAYGVRIVKRLGMGALLSGPGAAIDALASDEQVPALAGDEVVTSTMSVTTQSTGSNQLWANKDGRRYFDGATGAGIVVAVLDSGIAPHEDVASRLRLSRDFTGTDTTDGYGHGTHVAGIIAGSGRGSRNSAGTAYVGMAPGAELISLKVLGADGNGFVSDVIEAIEWAIDNRSRHRIRVLNMSLGHVAEGSHRDDPLAQAVERAVAAGLVVVSSAGNWGKSKEGTPLVGAIVSPGYTPGALTVGAVNTKKTIGRGDDAVASFSSRGPVGDPDDKTTWEMKPDVVAPGNAIVAAGLVGTKLFDDHQDRQVVGDNGGSYLMLSGTSMAAAVVSGAVAQLLQIQPRLTPAEVKFALQYTAERLADFDLIDQGAGSVNVALAAALVRNREVDTAPSSVEIDGQQISGTGVVFGSALKVTGTPSAGGVGGDGLVWGSRGVGGDALVWGSRGVGGDALVWGSRGVGGDALVWGSRGVGGDALAPGVPVK